MTRSNLLIALAAAATLACTHVRATPLAPVAYPAVPADSVRFFATNPPGKYVEIAMMRVEGLATTDTKSARALRAKAAQLGANGVILLNARAMSTHGGGSGVGVIFGGRHTGSAVVFGDDGNEEVKEFERAVAIRYEAEPVVAQGASSGAPR